MFPDQLRPLGLFALADFSHLASERAFCTLLAIMTETAIVSFRTLPTGLPLPTITVSYVNTTLFPLILDLHV